MRTHFIICFLSEVGSVKSIAPQETSQVLPTFLSSFILLRLASVFCFLEENLALVLGSVQQTLSNKAKYTGPCLFGLWYYNRQVQTVPLAQHFSRTFPLNLRDLQSGGVLCK